MHRTKKKLEVKIKIIMLWEIQMFQRVTFFYYALIYTYSQLKTFMYEIE